jgi:hypothetical protein
MPLAPQPGRTKHRLVCKLLLGAIILVAIATAAMAVYALINRRGDSTMTPAGVDYGPGTEASPRPGG